jgi:hypothetical protein
MTGEELDVDIIISLFEAPRWAPYNNRPWRFIYAMRNTLVIVDWSKSNHSDQASSPFSSSLLISVLSSKSMYKSPHLGYEMGLLRCTIV